jgi:hypothetical protein
VLVDVNRQSRALPLLQGDLCRRGTRECVDRRAKTESFLAVAARWSQASEEHEQRRVELKPWQIALAKPPVSVAVCFGVEVQAKHEEQKCALGHQISRARDYQSSNYADYVHVHVLSSFELVRCRSSQGGIKSEQLIRVHELQ